MKRFLAIVLLLQLFAATALHGKDYTVIERLPQKLSEAKKEGHKGWDSGITPKMKEATSRYNDTLLAMIKTLVSVYYAKGYIAEAEIDGYLKGLYTVHGFRQDAVNPTGESQGTMAALGVLSGVSGDLESTVEDMVQSIVADDPKFDYKAWKQRWRKVTHTGD
jgi:hypothetical protein